MELQILKAKQKTNKHNTLTGNNNSDNIHFFIIANEKDYSLGFCFVFIFILCE